jgi:hypothetical protein
VKRLEAAERRYASRAARVVSLPTPLMSAWKSFDFGQRRSILTDVVAEVGMGPAIGGLSRFDPGRLTIIWKV